MKKQIIVYGLLSISCFLASCSSNKPVDASEERNSLISSIDSLHKTMFDQKSMSVNREVAFKAVGLYQSFVTKFPEDSLAPEYLFRSSDLTMSLGDTLKSMEYLNNVCKKYPTYKKVPECLFLQGYYYQDKDSSMAKDFYNQLITKYPNHPFVDDAKALMHMFGKSEQDIVKDFEKKDQEKKKI